LIVVLAVGAASGFIAGHRHGKWEDSQEVIDATDQTQNAIHRQSELEADLTRVIEERDENKGRYEAGLKRQADQIDQIVALRDAVARAEEAVAFANSKAKADVEREREHARQESQERKQLEAAEPALTLVEKYLHSGELAPGERALQRAMELLPKDDQLRFALGALQFVRAVERLGRSLHKYGVNSEISDIPILRLPVPNNPAPSPVTYTDFCAILDQFRGDLSVAEVTLRGVTDDRVKLPIRLARIRLDLRGDGNATDLFIDIMKKIMRQQKFDFLRENPDFLVCFDRGDVAWMRAYCHLIMGMIDFYLAFDTEKLFDLSARDLFANPKNAFKGNEDERRRILQESWKVMAVREPARLSSFRRHFIKVAELNRETWKHIRAETDDDHEWLPNPKQNGVLGLHVSDEMIDRWLAAVREVETLLDGKTVFPTQGLFGIDRNGKGLNLRTLLDDPPAKFNLEFGFFKDLPEKYFSEGKEADLNLLFRVIEVFGNDTTAFAYAAWFN
jgi:hypothetical protein